MSKFHPKEIPAEACWYCVQVKPRQEPLTARLLKTEALLEVFCPSVRFKRARREGAMWVTEAMFPRYVFCRFPYPERHRHVLAISGVASIVRFGERPAIVPDVVISDLRAHVTDAETIVLPQAIEEGSEVRIIEGVYAGLQAVVSRVLPAQKRVAVLMEVLGMEREVQIGIEGVLPEASHPLAPR